MKNTSTDQIVISGALANLHNPTINETFLKYLTDNITDADLYRVKLDGFGGAAFDWRIVSRVGSIATILGFLLNFYTDLPKSKDSATDAGIYITLGKGDKQSSQFWIRGNVANKEIFIEQVVQEARRITTSKSDQVNIDRLINETRESKCWVKIK